jgi:hypothetical protein
MTRQYKQLQAFEPSISQEAVNFKLLGLMLGEVEYAAKTAMTCPNSDIGTLINSLEDIVDKTRLGKNRFPAKNLGVLSSKIAAEHKEKPKVSLSELKCFRRISLDILPKIVNRILTC